MDRRRIATHRDGSAGAAPCDPLSILPSDVLLTAFSHWDAEELAVASITCHHAYAMLDGAVALAVKRLGYRELPPPRGPYDTRTHRLRHLRRLAARHPQTLTAGPTTSFCIVGGRTVLEWGGGDDAERCFTIPSPVAGIGVAVREVAAGDSHCLMLAADGVYSWGSDNVHGQLGHGDVLPRQEPRRIEALAAAGVTEVAQVCCGPQHSLVLSVAGEVRSFGRGSLGRLGLGDTHDVHTPQPLLYATTVTGVFTRGTFERAVQLNPLPRVVQLSAGLFHSMAVTEGGTLYSWGSGTNGRLGHGDTVMQLRPREVEALASVDVVHASAGSGHSVAVSACGALYSWGQGYSGRLGHGNQETKPQPALVESLSRQKITSAVAGSEFTICITARGAAYAFGNDDYTGTVWWGRGWEGGSARALLPARIKALDEARVDQAAAGNAHALLRTDRSEIFTFGSGEHGQLGHGDLKESLLPRKVEAVELP